MASVYRTIDGDQPNRYSTAPRAEKSAVELREAAAREEVEKRKRSKAEPSSLALPRTKEWAANLPLDVQPHELIRTFGRVANLLAANWNDSAATVACFYHLLSDTRGNRKGFPPRVKTELLTLQSYFVSQTVGGVMLGDELRRK